MRSKKSILIKIARIVAFSIVMCAVMTGLFYLYSKGVPKALAALEEKGKMSNTIWVVEHFTPMLTIAGLIIALVLIYKLVKAPVNEVQSEKGWIMLLVALFTYGVILPYVIKASWGCFLPVPEGEEDIKSLLEHTASWFVIQIIPFMITVTYHFVRARRIRKDDSPALAQTEQSISDMQKTEEQDEE